LILYKVFDCRQTIENHTNNSIAKSLFLLSPKTITKSSPKTNVKFAAEIGVHGAEMLF
jgi:hypothetical protein